MTIYQNNLPQLITGGFYLLVNLWLLYTFLTPRRHPAAQAALLAGAVLAVLFLHPLLRPLGIAYRLRSYLAGCLFLVPCLLIFGESPRAKVFVFFMNYTLTQFTYLVFRHLDRLLSPPVPLLCVGAGLVLELAAIPIMRRRLRAPVREILEIIDQQRTALSLFPFLSFALLAHYDLTGRYDLAGFVALVLSTVIIFFAYYLISVSISVTKRRQELERISSSDSLTGIYNRRHMERRLEEELERIRRGGAALSVAMVDVDFFKRINDEHGHDCGDFVLKEIVAGIGAEMRASDILGRWGGEEFLLLLPAADGEQAMLLGERVRRAVEGREYEYGGLRLKATVTVGVAQAKPGDRSAPAVKRADLALYRGKRRGRNCVVLYDECGGRDAD